MTMYFTRRQALQLTAQLFDPLGLIASYLIRFKIALREVVAHQIGWDDELPEAMQKTWKKLIAEAVIAEPLHFPKSMRSSDVVGSPEIVGFFDESDAAYAAVVYIRWRTQEEGMWHTSLVTAKSCVTPQAGCTTPRAELCGLLMLVRLVNSVLASLDVPATHVTLMGDSMCTISSYQVNAASLSPYFANRVVEILTTMKAWGPESETDARQEMTDCISPDMCAVDKLYHLPGERNMADWPSHGNLEWKDLGSTWQQGPDFIRQLRDTWPITKDFIQEIPPEERRKKFLQVLTVKELPWNEQRLWKVMEYSNNIDKVRAVYARLIKANKLRDKLTISYPLIGEDFDEADKLMNWLSMLETVKLLRKNPLESLNPFWRNGICYTRGRAGVDGMQALYQHSELIVISPKSRSRKYGYWIVDGKKLSNHMAKACTLCKKLKANDKGRLLNLKPRGVKLISFVPAFPQCQSLSSPPCFVGA